MGDEFPLLKGGKASLRESVLIQEGALCATFWELWPPCLHVQPCSLHSSDTGGFHKAVEQHLLGQTHQDKSAHSMQHPRRLPRAWTHLLTLQALLAPACVPACDACHHAAGWRRPAVHQCPCGAARQQGDFGCAKCGQRSQACPVQPLQHCVSSVCCTAMSNPADPVPRNKLCS